MKRTLILTSRQNFVWKSMEEIIPMREELWQMTEEKGVHEVHFFNVDTDDLKKHSKTFLTIDQIYVSCFNLNIVKALKWIRLHLALDARFIIELHNMASIACWPFHHFGLGESLRESDFFIASSQADITALKLSFVNPQVILLPFTSKEKISIEPNPKKEFIYAGRISSQKNIQTLIAAFSLLKNKDFILRIFGKEDDLGSPNMGLQSLEVLNFLKKLVVKLGLENKIIFEGPHTREELYKKINKTGQIFVSASLHADENFGMVLFRALRSNQFVIASSWGGHRDYPLHFKKRIKLVPVFKSDKGPIISPFDFKRSLEENFFGETFVDSYYETLSLIFSLKQIIEEKFISKNKLKKTHYAQNVLASHEKWQQQNPCQAFSSYEDPLASPLFEAYGMTENRLPQKLFILPPWAEVENNKLCLYDIHRGNDFYDLGGDISIFTWERKVLSVSLKTFEDLWRKGHLFSEDDW